MSNRRGRKEGSVYQRADGVWVGSVSLGLDGNGNRRRRVVYGKTKTIAMTKLRELQTAAHRGQLGDVVKLTVGEYLRQWLDAKRPTVAANTYIGYETQTNKFLIPNLGGVRLVTLTSMHVQGLYADLSAGGVSPAMQRKIGTTLTIALQHAVHPLRLLTHNPAKDVPKPRAVAREMQVLDPDQLRRFLAAAQPDRLYALWAVSVDSAARQGELFALQWGDVDFDGSAITIKRSLEEVRGILKLKDTKTKKSRRRIPLSTYAMEALAERRKTALAEGNYGPEKPVFCDHQGGWLRKSNVLRRSFQPIIKRANDQIAADAKKFGIKPVLLPGIRPYDLRHTGATLLLLAGESVKVVSERLGHSTAMQTLDVYSHVLPGMQEKAAAKLDAIFRAVPVDRVAN